MCQIEMVLVLDVNVLQMCGGHPGLLQEVLDVEKNDYSVFYNSIVTRPDFEMHMDMPDKSENIFGV